MKIVLTCTTWRLRINFAGQNFARFIESQTVKPDIIYCWLAEEEFPNKAKDLPEEFLNFIDKFNVKLSWTEKNEYCHKRWHIYDDNQHLNDFVVSVDDDIVYPATLIEEGLKMWEATNKRPVILQYMNMFREFGFNNDIKRVYLPIPSFDSIKLQFYGQTIFTPGSFPIEAWTPEMHEIRMKICPKCDESWFQPFLVHNKIFLLRNGNAISVHEDEIDDLQSVGIRNSLYKSVVIDKESYPIADLYKYIVLRKFPYLMQSWQLVFPSYNTSKLDKYSVEELLRLL